jgi:hypothetical protein
MRASSFTVFSFTSLGNTGLGSGIWNKFSCASLGFDCTAISTSWTPGCLLKVYEKRLQVAQGLAADKGFVVQFHPGADVRIKHPVWNLEDWESTRVVQSATQQWRAISNPDRLRKPSLPVPRMESVANFSNISNMGFSLLGCITGGGHTQH